MSKYSERVKAARLPERTVAVCLRADLVADHEAADAELRRRMKTPADSLGGDGLGALRDRIQALEAEMAEATDQFRLRALPKNQFRTLVADHPPRRDPETGDVNLADARVGVNNATFFDALIRVSVVNPELDDDDWRALLGDNEQEVQQLKAAGLDPVDGVLTDQQYDKLSDAAWYLNRGEIDVPFSRAASRLNQDSEPE